MTSFQISVRYFCVRNLTNPVSAAHPVFASAEPEAKKHLCTGLAYYLWYQRRDSNSLKNANLALKGL